MSYRGGGNGGRKVPPLPHQGQEDGFSRALAMPFALYSPLPALDAEGPEGGQKGGFIRSL